MSEVVTKRKADELGEEDVQDKKRPKQNVEKVDVENGKDNGNDSDEEEWDDMDKEVQDLGKEEHILGRRTRGVRVDYSKLDIEGQDTDEDDEDEEGDDEDGVDEDRRVDQEEEEEEDDVVAQVPNGDKKAAEVANGENVGVEEEDKAVAASDEASEGEKEKEKGGYEDDVEGAE